MGGNNFPLLGGGGLGRFVFERKRAPYLQPERLD